MRDPLARAMLPVLLHRVANATQHLNGLSALLALDPGALEARGGDLAETSEVVDETGWLLALLASAHGAHLLLARRERHGLRPLVACVQECLRREGRDLGDPGTPLPDLAPHVADGWQLPWALGTWLYESGRSLQPGQSLAWTIRTSGEGARFEAGAVGADPSFLRRRLERDLPGSVLGLGGGGWSLSFPTGWLLPSTDPA
ncbi:MAG: hypothetical protein ACKVXR_06565 [Planctomycetota bacterium]